MLRQLDTVRQQMTNGLELSVTPLNRLSASAAREWDTLASAVGANISLCSSWIRVTAKSHGIFEDAEVVAVRRNRDLVAVLPLFLSRRHVSGFHLRVLGLVSNLVSYHNQPVTTLAAHELWPILLLLSRERRVDVVHFAGLPKESPFSRFVAVESTACVNFSIPGAVSPYLTLSPGWHALLAGKSKKFRYKLRKRAELLEQDTSLAMRWFSKPAECSELLNDMKVIESNSWKKDAGVSIFQRDHERRYHAALLPFLAGQNGMFANVLYKDGKPIAYNLCCVQSGWVGQLKTSFDTAHSELSPGSIVIDHAIHRAIELGANEFDFLGDQDPHKMAWTKDVRPHSDHFLYLKSSLRGRLVGNLKRFRERFRQPVQRDRDAGSS